MTKKEKPQEPQNTSGSSIVVPVAFKTRSPRDKFLAIGVIIAALFLVTSVVIFLIANKKEQVPLKTGQAISGQVETMQHDDLVKLSTARVNPKRNMDRAYAKALAYGALGNKNEAIKQYEAIIATNKAPYYIYLDYAKELSLNNDPKKAVSVMQQAIEKLKADASIKAGEKEDILKQLNGKIDGFKDQAGIK